MPSTSELEYGCWCGCVVWLVGLQLCVACSREHYGYLPTVSQPAQQGWLLPP